MPSGSPSISGVDLGVIAVKQPQRGYICHKGKGGSVVAQKVSVTYACDYDQKEIPQGQHRLRALEAGEGATLPPPLLGTAIVVLYATCTLLALDAAHHGSELVLGWLG